MADKTVWKYGKLNPVRKPRFKRRLESNSDNALSSVRESTRETIYNQKLDLNGEFIAVILKKIVAPKSLESDSISFVSRIWGALGGNVQTPTVTQVKARIPEIHATIPEPTSSVDHRSIDLHTTFTVVVDQVGKSEFEYGELVFVRLYDSSGNYNPQVIKAFTGPNNNTMPEHQPEVSSKVEEPSVPFNAPPTGDKIGSGKKSNNETARTFVGPLPPQEFPTNHIGKTIVEILPAIPYTPNRVVVHEGISPLPKNSPLLVNVQPRPGSPQRIAKLHRLVADRFNALKEAALDDEGIEIYCQSGHREHRWKSQEDYEQKMIEEYGSVAKGRKFKAYVSAHETGLAVDFYIPATSKNEIDIAPSQPGQSKYGSKTNSEQKKTKAHRWLKENAHLFGFTPLLNEAWHWECLLPIESWKTAVEVTSNYNISNYDIRVRETSKANGTQTNQRNFSFE